MSEFAVRADDYQERVRRSFFKQSFLIGMGAELTHIAPGAVDIRLAARDGLQQQHGYFHAGVATTIADSAAGYAAFSLFAAGDEGAIERIQDQFAQPGQRGCTDRTGGGSSSRGAC